MLHKLHTAIRCPWKIFLHFSRPLEARGAFDRIPDEKWLKIRYWLRMGKFPDLENPKTYSEKVQWLKLYDRNPAYPALVDKYQVKQYVAEKIGPEYVLPTLGLWDRAEDIDFSALPERFVLKCTHDSGSILICTDKSRLDQAAARAQLNQALQFDYYLRKGREWPYKLVKPRIMAEPYLEDSISGELRDYKFFAFDGEVKALYIASDRQKPGQETKFDFYDPAFHHLELQWGHPNAPEAPPKPAQFDRMQQLAQTLAAGLPHVRVDFYQVDGKVYFGECTLYTYSGMTPFTPEAWDRVFGDWLTLPQSRCEEKQ